MSTLDKTNYICPACSTHLMKGNYEKGTCPFGHKTGFMTFQALYNELLNNGDISADNVDFDPQDFGYEGFDINDQTYYKESEQ